MTKMEEENKKLTKKLKDSENIISQLRKENLKNKEIYEEEEEIEDFAEDPDEQIMTSELIKLNNENVKHIVKIRLIFWHFFSLEVAPFFALPRPFWAFLLDI
uniref:Uncharacterized protein n=1 Tax=Meloidogyne enterolobii TaxID=390850 RepID=A0A6V7TKP7_MELEN|nr:unnamed protein product [Meloidogyne enterolobii]